MAEEILPPGAYEAADVAFEEFRVSKADFPRDELEAALVAAALLIRADERERIRQMAIRNNAVCVGDEGTNCYFADLLGPQQRSDEKEGGRG